MYSILQLKSNVSNSIVVELSSYMWDWSCTDILVQHREVWLIRPQLQKAMYWQECLERVMLQPFAFLISKLILFLRSYRDIREFTGRWKGHQLKKQGANQKRKKHRGTSKHQNARLTQIRRHHFGINIEPFLKKLSYASVKYKHLLAEHLNEKRHKVPKLGSYFKELLLSSSYHHHLHCASFKALPKFYKGVFLKAFHVSRH